VIISKPKSKKNIFKKCADINDMALHKCILLLPPPKRSDEGYVLCLSVGQLNYARNCERILTKYAD